ncbi:MAG: hypothetical protein P8Y91_01520 [Desulfuromonadales bacterium]|jgi:hypothetical protein
MTYSRTFLPLVLCLLILFALLSIWTTQRVSAYEKESLALRRDLAKRLQLTDLALWSEARYARHPSQADLFTAFQEFPSAPEHFPAGSLMAPPPFNMTTQIKTMPGPSEQ